MRLFVALVLAVGCVTLASCGGASMPASSTLGSTGLNVGSDMLDAIAQPMPCYVEDGARRVVMATITFYGWPDNTPPGRAIAHPVIHSLAGGAGTYCNPITFATEPTRTENASVPYGTKIYVPFLGLYFLREDDCTPSGPRTGNGNNGCYHVWFDLWVGGDKDSNTNAVVNCEDDLTPLLPQFIILNPPAGLPMGRAGPLYRDYPLPAGECNGLPGSTAFPG